MAYDGRGVVANLAEGPGDEAIARGGRSEGLGVAVQAGVRVSFGGAVVGVVGDVGVGFVGLCQGADVGGGVGVGVGCYGERGVSAWWLGGGGAECAVALESRGEGGGQCRWAVSTDGTSSSVIKLSARMLPCQRTRSGSTCLGSGRMAVARVDSPWRSRTTSPTIGRAQVTSVCAGRQTAIFRRVGMSTKRRLAVSVSGLWPLVVFGSTGSKNSFFFVVCLSCFFLLLASYLI